MKKKLAILLCLILLLGCASAAAEAAGKTYLATVDMNGAFQLQCTLPEGYEIEEIESTNATYIAQFKADSDRPLLALSIAYNELYSDVPRMNDLDAEGLALIEESFRTEDDVAISYTETAYGTKLMVIKEVEGTVNYVDFYSIYLGYEIEIVVVSQNETGLSDEQIQMAVDFLSELDFAAPEDDIVPQPEGGKRFEGVWQCDRATIAINWEEEGYKVLVTWGSSAWEQTEWQYSCFYHEEDNTLDSVPFGIRTEYMYGDDGELVSATDIYSDGEAVFSLDAEGCLIWQDQKDHSGEGMRFTRLPDEPAALSFSTIGDAMASEGYTGIAGGDDQHFVVVVIPDDSYIRLVADLDEKAKGLGDAMLGCADADEQEAASAAYNAYIESLPVTYEETITARPRTQEELDALVGKTLLETEEAGYKSSSSHTGEDDAAIYTVSYGLFEYDLLLNETYTEYMKHNDNGFIGDLTVKSVCFSGLSHNAAELSYHADGSYDEDNDSWAEFNGIMEQITNALSSDNPEEAIQALIEAMPEQAEEIKMLADIISSMSEQDEDSGTEADDAAQTEDPF